MNAGRIVPRIVVGIDGSAMSVQALKWALRQAGITGAVVQAVAVWDIPSGSGFGPTVVDGEDLADTAERVLTAAVAEASVGLPSVEVQQLVRRGHPAAVLVNQAEGAELLVVGSRGRGGFVGALLGSVSQHCVHHATCPVVVVRSGS